MSVTLELAGARRIGGNDVAIVAVATASWSIKPPNAVSGARNRERRAERYDRAGVSMLGECAKAEQRSDDKKRPPKQEFQQQGTARGSAWFCPQSAIAAVDHQFTFNRQEEYLAIAFPVRQSSRLKFTHLSLAPAARKQFTVSANPSLASTGILKNVGPTSTRGSLGNCQLRSYSTSSCLAFLSLDRQASNLTSVAERFGLFCAAGRLDRMRMEIRAQRTCRIGASMAVFHSMPTGPIVKEAMIG